MDRNNVALARKLGQGGTTLYAVREGLADGIEGRDLHSERDAITRDPLTDPTATDEAESPTGQISAAISIAVPAAGAHRLGCRRNPARKRENEPPGQLSGRRDRA